MHTQIVKAELLVKSREEEWCETEKEGLYKEDLGLWEMNLYPGFSERVSVSCDSYLIPFPFKLPQMVFNLKRRHHLLYPSFYMPASFLWLSPWPPNKVRAGKNMIPRDHVTPCHDTQRVYPWPDVLSSAQPVEMRPRPHVTM